MIRKGQSGTMVRSDYATMMMSYSEILLVLTGCAW